jgi:hypothetical protein
MWGITSLPEKLLAFQEELYFMGLVGWLVGWLVGRSVGQSVAWLAGRPVGWLFGWWVGSFVCSVYVHIYRRVSAVFCVLHTTLRDLQHSWWQVLRFLLSGCETI